MKTYKFAVNNWKSELPGFWFYKQFPSAYYADRWAMKITYGIKNSMYMVICCFGEEA